MSCWASVIGGSGLTETMHQQLGSDMVTSPSFSDMKHHVPNEGITVEASRPAWPIENPDCMHALRWMRCGNVTKTLPKANAQEVL